MTVRPGDGRSRRAWPSRLAATRWGGAPAVAAAVRVAFRLSTWVLPVVVAVMVLYPGTARVVHGYQASLLFMVIATAGVAVLILAAGTTGRLLAAGAMFAAACLAHVVL